MNEEFITDMEVEEYERRSDPARRAVVWSLAAVAAAFVLVGGAYLFGTLGRGAGGLTASLLSGVSEEGEVFPLWSAGRNTNNTKGNANNTNENTSRVTACSFDSSPLMNSGQAISLNISEIAWMGTEEGAQYEWLEIANTNSTNGNANDTNKEVAIGGWSVVDKDEQIQFVFPKNTRVPAGGFLLLARGVDRVGGVKVDYRYTGNLKNEDEGLRLFNADCEVMDEAFASPKWPAGDAKSKKTMERNLAARSTNRSGQARAWYTSSLAGGTPKAPNSEKRGTDLDEKIIETDRRGEESGTSAVPTSLSAASSTTNVSDVSDRSGMSDRTDMSGTTDSTGSPQVVISEVMAGKDSVGNWDFVELHNIGSVPVLLTGWSVKKHSSTGAESALVAAGRLEGKTIPAGGYLLLTHPDYGGSPAADVVWPKSYALAYTSNAVTLYGASGARVSEISWTEIPKGQSYAEQGGVWRAGAPTPRSAP